MSLVDELKKLEDLHRFGTLTDEEFVKAKAMLLMTPQYANPPAASAGNDYLSRQLAEVRYQNEIARIDREWDIDKEQYKVTTKYGRRHLPTPGSGWAMAAITGVFGTLWLIMAISMMNNAPAGGLFGEARLVLPAFGFLFIAVGVGMGMYYEKKAAAYSKAVAEYQARRAALKLEDFR